MLNFKPLTFSFKIPDDFAITYDDVEGELVVGGVFLRLFIAQPSWVSTFLFHHKPILQLIRNACRLGIVPRY